MAMDDGTVCPMTQGGGMRSMFKGSYSMYYIPIRQFLELERLLPHQDMLSRGLVKEWTPAMRGKIIGVSHQWLAYAEADPDGEHLRTIQSLLRRLLEGRFTRVEDFWLHKLLFKTSSLRMTGKAWEELLLGAGIWVDYSCMPQVSFSLADAASGDNEEGTAAVEVDEALHHNAAKAVNSLPYYMQQCSFLLVCAPACTHRDTGEPCNYSTWRTRGWCRLELNMTLLSVSEIRSMVITGEDAEPFLIHPFDGPKMAPGEGDFTCCSLDHKMPGTGRPIACDRIKARKTLELMVAAKVLNLHKDGMGLQAHFFTSLRHRYLAGLPASARHVQSSLGTICHFKLREALRKECELQSSSGDGAEALKRRLKWTEKDDLAARSTGFTLLMCAAIADDTSAVRELMKEGANPNQGLLNNYFDLTYMVKGNTPVFAAMAFGSFDTVAAMLDSEKANPMHLNSMGMDALMAACCKGTEDNVKAWLERFPDWPVNRTIPVMSLPAAGIACLTGARKGPLVRSIIESMANLRCEDYWGGGNTLLCIAANSCDCDVDLVATLLEHRADPNEAWKSPSKSWRTLLFGLRHRGCVRQKSVILSEMAMLEGSTPLHFAAKRHDVPVVALLLSSRAEQCVNKQGHTPLDMARIFGGGSKAPEVLEAMLEVKQPSQIQEAVHELPSLLTSARPAAGAGSKESMPGSARDSDDITDMQL